MRGPTRRRTRSRASPRTSCALIRARGRDLFAWFKAHPGLHNAINLLAIVFLLVADGASLLYLPRLWLTPGEPAPWPAVLIAAAVAGSVHSYLLYSLSVFSMHEGAAHNIVFVGKGRLARLAQTVGQSRRPDQRRRPARVRDHAHGASREVRHRRRCGVPEQRVPPALCADVPPAGRLHQRQRLHRAPLDDLHEEPDPLGGAVDPVPGRLRRAGVPVRSAACSSRSRSSCSRRTSASTWIACGSSPSTT